MGKPVTGWEDWGTHILVYAHIPARRNGLPNTGAMQAALNALDSVNPDAYDPVEGVSEAMARAAQRDRPQRVPASADSFDASGEWIEITADRPPLPDFGVPLLDAGLLPDDDEIVFPRACPVGGCGED